MPLNFLSISALRLSIKRMNKSRQVNVTVHGKADDKKRTPSDESSEEPEKPTKAEKAKPAGE